MKMHDLVMQRGVSPQRCMLWYEPQWHTDGMLAMKLLGSTNAQHPAATGLSDMPFGKPVLTDRAMVMTA